MPVNEYVTQTRRWSSVRVKQHTYRPTANGIQSQPLNSRYLISRKEHLARDWNVKSGKYLDGTLTSILPSTPALAGGETSDPLVPSGKTIPCHERREQGDREKHGRVHRAKHVVSRVPTPLICIRVHSPDAVFSCLQAAVHCSPPATSDTTMHPKTVC